VFGGYRVIEGFEQLLRNEKRSRDEIGQIVVGKLRENASWHPAIDQLYDAFYTAQALFATYLRRLDRLCRQAKERRGGCVIPPRSKPSMLSATG
jgi:hypothetical protein